MATAAVDRSALESKVTSMYAAGLTAERVEDNTDYRFISDRARKVTATWGVKSVSILARKS